MSIPNTFPFQQRLEKLQAGLIQEKFNNVLIHQNPYIFHFTGWLPPAWMSAFLLITPKHVVFISPSIPDEAAPIWSRTIEYTNFRLDEVVQSDQEALHALQAAIGELGLSGQGVAVALGSFPSTYSLPLSSMVQWSDASALLHSLTAVKDELAIAEIRKRVAMLDRAFETAGRLIRPGLTELELFSSIYASLAQSLGSPFTLDCDLGSGHRTILDEPQPTDKPLQMGETVLIDLFPNLGGYVADITRNFIVGQPTPGQERQHSILEEALSNVEKILRPGVTSSEIDRTARRCIDGSEFREFIYRHHTGHAFGVTTPEPPVIIPADRTVLQAGMVIAVEPGIYHPVNGGMRLEGNYLITEDGFEALHRFPAQLTAGG